VILSAKPPGWESFLAALEGADIPDDFLGPSDRSTTTHDRDPFAGWTE
jgi:antitoxin VapB